MTFDTTTGMLALLGQWTERGWLRELDRALAMFLAEQAPDVPPLVILGAALASHQLGRGHVCLDLQATLEDSSFALSLPPDGQQGDVSAAGDVPPALPAAVLLGVDLAQWQAACDAAPGLVAHGVGNTPMVRAGSRLYLRRYWQYERDVRGAIDRRLALGAAGRDALPPMALRHALDVLFPSAVSSPAGIHAPPAHADWQKMACALAARNAFSIVTGGPGTGKTTTVVKLLALLQSLELDTNLGADDAVAAVSARALRIRLAAPTGKAAARLNESIAGAVRSLRLDGLAQAEAVRASIPTEVTTLHRLLGSRPDSRRFRHHAGNPLPLDVLVVDEASMVDLEMMAALLAALPEGARLVLLGDKDQLASVEAGAVLGELCLRAGEGHYLPQTRDWLQAVSGEVVAPELLDPHGTALDQAVAMLRHSHRFTADSGIGRLAEAVNAGDVAALRSVWRSRHPDLSRLGLAGPGDAPLRALAIDGAATEFPSDGRGRIARGDVLPPPVGYRHYLEKLRDGQPAAAHASLGDFDAWARDVLEAYGQFQVLCALRRGPWGVEGLNQRIAALLVDAGLLPHAQGWYLGRPVLVMRNDYGLGLMNGDIGITLVLPQAGADGVNRLALRVAFAAGDGSNAIRWVLPSRLQSVESVFAMTVHKSQGSEFTHAALVLPDRLNPVLTRELIYTGITRARHWFSLAEADPSHRVMEDATRRRVRRASGLLDDGDD